MLAFCVPVIAVASLAVRLTSSGPVFVQVPCRRRDGTILTLTEFRTVQTAPPATADPDSTTASTVANKATLVGAALRASHLVRLPVLLDVWAGRIGFREALFG